MYGKMTATGLFHILSLWFFHLFALSIERSFSVLLCAGLPG